MKIHVYFYYFKGLKLQWLYLLICLVFFCFFFFFFNCTMWKFPGLGSDLRHSSDKAKSLTVRPPGNSSKDFLSKEITIDSHTLFITSQTLSLISYLVFKIGEQVNLIVLSFKLKSWMPGLATRPVEAAPCTYHLKPQHVCFLVLQNTPVT